MSESFVPVEVRRGWGIQSPIRASGQLVDGPDDPRVTSIDALAPQLIPGGRVLQLTRYFDVPVPIVAIYYATSSIGESETLSDLLQRGGITVIQQPAGVFDAATVVAEVGERAGRVQVGPYPAAMVHADPQGPHGIRTYDLYWSDGVRDWGIEGGVPAGEQVIDLARSVYCQ